MAREITVQSGLRIRKEANGLTLQNYQGQGPSQWTLDMAGNFGPSPGAVLVSTEGTDIDLSALGVLGVAEVYNASPVNHIKIGIWNPDQAEFYPFLRIPPSRKLVLTLDPDLNEEYAGTGTGTTGQLNTLRAIAENADSVLVFNGFDA